MATNKPIAITAKKVEENIDTLCPQVGDYLSQYITLFVNWHVLSILQGSGDD